MVKYAYEGSDVPVDRSIGKIKDMLWKHGAKAIQVNEVPEHGIMQFVFSRKIVVDGKEMLQPIKLEIRYGKRKPSEALRMMYWHLKVKFDAIDWGLISFEEEFLPYMVMLLPSGEKATVAEAMLPDLRKGQLPPYFEGMGGDKKLLEGK